MEYLSYVEIYYHLEKEKNDFYKYLNQYELLKSKIIKATEMKEIVDFSKSTKNDKLDNYAYMIPILEDRIETSKKILSELEFNLTKEKRKLYESKNVYDIIFRLRFLEFENVKSICKLTGYEKTRVYDFINKIKIDKNNIKEKYKKIASSEKIGKVL